MRSYVELEPDGPRGWSPLAVAFIATLVLLLGLGGALFGIHVANQEATGRPDLGATPQQQVVSTATRTPIPNPLPSPTPTPAATNTADAFALPNLAGMSFKDARTKVRDLGLGWLLEFAASGTDPAVRATEPGGGAMVKRGTTIKIFVKGAAPLATVPAVLGLACEQAASIIVDQGLYPDYKTGRDGVVLSQTLTSGIPHWNDKVQIGCGAPP